MHSMYLHTDCFIVSSSKILEGIGSYVAITVGTKSFNDKIMMGARLFPVEHSLPLLIQSSNGKVETTLLHAKSEMKNFGR